MSIVHRAVGLLFTASRSLIAIAQFGSRGSSPKNTTNLAHTFDQLLKKNQQLLKNNQQLLGEVAEGEVAELVGPGKARTKVKAEKTTAKIAACLFSLVRKGFR